MILNWGIDNVRSGMTKRSIMIFTKTFATIMCGPSLDHISIISEPLNPGQTKILLIILNVSYFEKNERMQF